MKIKVLYEDKDILAIDKPINLATHSDGKTKEKTLVDFILKNYPKMKNVGEPMTIKIKDKEIELPRPGIVHRLDRDTSGVLLLAKNKKSFSYLKELFQNREIRKVYYALVNGTLKYERGTINKPIGRSPKDFRRYLAGRGAKGELRDAVTEYTVLKNIVDKKGHKFTLLEVRPKTGRTHQIRAHMKYLNHPVVGDALYNEDGIGIKGIDRMMLHAKSIKFKNLSGDIIKIESPLPEEFKNLI
jgi:23S rRNA pseudouridine1911/1915/1917 synthase